MSILNRAISHETYPGDTIFRVDFFSFDALDTNMEGGRFADTFLVLLSQRLNRPNTAGPVAPTGRGTAFRSKGKLDLTAGGLCTGKKL
jgi:hypothetical protein